MLVTRTVVVLALLAYVAACDGGRSLTNVPTTPSPPSAQCERPTSCPAGTIAIAAGLCATHDAASPTTEAGAPTGATIETRAMFSGNIDSDRLWLRAVEPGVVPVVDGMLDLRIVSTDDSRWFLDQLFMEADGQRIFPDDLGYASVLAQVDTRGVLIEPHTELHARFRAPAPGVETHFYSAGRLVPSGETPVVRAAKCDAPIACPRGSRPDTRGGCDAVEPLYDARSASVRVEVTCMVGPCSIARENGEVVFVPTTSKVASLAPGRYSFIVGDSRTPLFVHPRTPIAIAGDSRPPQGNLHCPHVAWLDPSTGDYTTPGEILHGRNGARRKALQYEYTKPIMAKDGIIELRLSEIEPEIAYIDQLVLEFGDSFLLPDGDDASVLAHTDGHVLRLEENRQVHVRFRLPKPWTGAADAYWFVDGYYERTSDAD